MTQRFLLRCFREINPAGKLHVWYPSVGKGTIHYTLSELYVYEMIIYQHEARVEIKKFIGRNVRYEI